MTNDKDENKSIERRRAKLGPELPDETELRRLLTDDVDPMTLREHACYIAGYVTGFAKGSGELVP